MANRRFVLIGYFKAEEPSLAVFVLMNSHYDNQPGEKKRAKASCGNQNKIIFARGKEKEERLLVIKGTVAYFYDNQQVKHWQEHFLASAVVMTMTSNHDNKPEEKERAQT